MWTRVNYISHVPEDAGYVDGGWHTGITFFNCPMTMGEVLDNVSCYTFGQGVDEFELVSCSPVAPFEMKWFQTLFDRDGKPVDNEVEMGVGDDSSRYIGGER